MLQSSDSFMKCFHCTFNHFLVICTLPKFCSKCTHVGQFFLPFLSNRLLSLQGIKSILSEFCSLFRNIFIKYLNSKEGCCKTIYRIETWCTYFRNGLVFLLFKISTYGFCLSLFFLVFLNQLFFMFYSFFQFNTSLFLFFYFTGLNFSDMLNVFKCCNNFLFLCYKVMVQFQCSFLHFSCKV